MLESIVSHQVTHTYQEREDDFEVKGGLKEHQQEQEQQLYPGVDMNLSVWNMTKILEVRFTFVRAKDEEESFDKLHAV